MRVKLYRVFQEEKQVEESGAYGKGIYLLWSKSDALLMASREGNWSVETCRIKLDDLNGVSLIEPETWVSFARNYLNQDDKQFIESKLQFLQAQNYDWCMGPVIDNNMRAVLQAYDDGILSADELKEMFLSFSSGLYIVLISSEAKQRYKSGRKVRLGKRKKRTWASMRQTLQELAEKKLNDIYTSSLLDVEENAEYN